MEVGINNWEKSAVLAIVVVTANLKHFQVVLVRTLALVG